jgi:DTW domain-containing protein YfiP
MSRETCYRCFWPRSLCWCPSLVPMATRTRFVFLMHPKEYKREKAATGRLTHLCLPHSRILSGVSFENEPELRTLLDDPALHPVLLFPGATALNLSTAPTIGTPALADLRARLATRTLVVFILDATWALGRKMLRLSPVLQALPRLMFTPAAPSRYVIKQQPHPACLSTLEATHELLTALAAAGLDDYPLPAQLPAVFDRLQAFQLQCAADPDRVGYRHRPYKTPAERRPNTGASGRRRRKLFDLPAG